MTRELALAKFLKEEGDNLPIETIMLIKAALKWYDEDIDDVNWHEHILNITDMYVYMMNSMHELQELKTE